ncbi:hypothetical protein D6C77_03210 [Aureobasidium pullulans]|uniref:BTB domain-containing protein n=1 Tax=Aureobasidium pullulans TaxID=5580 RepID=A0A4T0BB45_AURPU|nr:hypothetical protein D6C83_07368 [Aureobasidium pullulans]TIA61779.1 hypothetical protein D6C77_03210 [Aureobasidium pullulans]
MVIPDRVIRFAYDRPNSDSLQYFDDKIYSDVTVRCGEDRIHVRKDVLCAWSDHFREHLERSSQIVDEELVLEGDDSALARAFLKYMYGAPYIDNPLDFTDDDSKRLNNLYKLGCKYGVWSLVFDMCITFSEYIELGYTGDKFFKAIELAYQLNESGDLLLAYISRACKYNIKQLASFEFYETLQRTPTLCVELLAHVVSKLDLKDDPSRDGSRLRCPDCRQFFTLHKSHVQSHEWMCGWCGYKAPAGGLWDRLS